ncbi:MAG: gamma-glutamylcyclotransferase family protein [Parafilimonas sp.]
MNGENYLFVYGTLRNGYNLKLKDKVMSDLEYVGKAKVDASLYDLGEYPGAIKENNSNEVIGDVFLISNPERVFKILDKYEGNEFNREKDRVVLRSGKSLDAWIYWYNQKPEKALKIRQKNYLNYLKSKKTA